MDTVLPVVLLGFLVCLLSMSKEVFVSNHLFFLVSGTTNGIKCYNCPIGCPDPFNNTNGKADQMESPNGWCLVCIDGFNFLKNLFVFLLEI